MLSLSGDHTALTSVQRCWQLLRVVGPRKTAGVLVSLLDDQYLRTFDRRYRVRTSGLILLASTSFDPARLRDATQYGPVNAWAFRHLLKELNLPRKLHFVDLGCGLGRPCLLAAEYGFEKVTGVDLARELCELARENAAQWRFRAAHSTPIAILQMDALDFCENSDDDVFFMFRPFSKEFLERILEKLAGVAARQKKQLIIIYSERMAHATSHRDAIAGHSGFEQIHESGAYGQAFYVYRSAPLSKSEVAAERRALAKPESSRSNVNRG